MRTTSRVLLALIVLLGVDGRSQPKPLAASAYPAADLVGEWRAQLQFTTGAFASIKDLEFMYVFSQGGTMTESSNYDAAPPVPPAYGVWRKTGTREFEARYEFFSTKATNPLEEIAKGGGWVPDGRGVLFEKITLAEDGKSFESLIRYDAFDQAGNPTESGSEGTSRGSRIGF